VASPRTSTGRAVSTCSISIHSSIRLPWSSFFCS